MLEHTVENSKAKSRGTKINFEKSNATDREGLIFSYSSMEAASRSRAALALASEPPSKGTPE